MVFRYKNTKKKYAKKKTSFKPKVKKDKKQDLQLKKLSRKVAILSVNRREFSSALSYSATTLVGPTSVGTGTTTTTIGLSPLSVSQGDTQITREGNQLRIVSWKMKLILSASQSQFNLTNFDNNMIFRVVIARPKQDDISTLATLINSELYTNGSGVTYAKNMQEFLYRPLNKDSMDIVFDKLIKILPLTTTDNTHNITTSLPSKREYNFDLTKWFPKIIRYAGTSTTPEIRPYGLFIACGLPEGFKATSTIQDSGYSPKLNVEQYNRLRFES